MELNSFHYNILMRSLEIAKPEIKAYYEFQNEVTEVDFEKEFQDLKDELGKIYTTFKERDIFNNISLNFYIEQKEHYEDLLETFKGFFQELRIELDKGEEQIHAAKSGDWKWQTQR